MIRSTAQDREDRLQKAAWDNNKKSPLDDPYFYKKDVQALVCESKYKVTSDTHRLVLPALAGVHSVATRSSTAPASRVLCDTGSAVNIGHKIFSLPLNPFNIPY